VIIDAREAFQLRTLDGEIVPRIGGLAFSPVPGEGLGFIERGAFLDTAPGRIAVVKLGGDNAGSVVGEVRNPEGVADFFPQRIELVIPQLGNYWIMGRDGHTARNLDGGLVEQIVPDDGGVDADQGRASVNADHQFRLTSARLSSVGLGLWSHALADSAGHPGKYRPVRKAFLQLPDGIPPREFFQPPGTDEVYAVAAPADGGTSVVLHGIFVDGSALDRQTMQGVGALDAREVTVDFYRSPSSPYLFSFSRHGISVWTISPSGIAPKGTFVVRFDGGLPDPPEATRFWLLRQSFPGYPNGALLIQDYAVPSAVNPSFVLVAWEDIATALSLQTDTSGLTGSLGGNGGAAGGGGGGAGSGPPLGPGVGGGTSTGCSAVAGASVTTALALAAWMLGTLASRRRVFTARSRAKQLDDR